MNDLRTAAQQALEVMQAAEVDPHSSDAVHKAITALRAALAEPREHVTDDTPCWCSPETTYVDPDTGVSVIVHKEPQ